jgi:quercetin dioxygenase-like cupin family protein
MQAITAQVLGSDAGECAWLGDVRVRYMLEGGDADPRFSMLELTFPPRALAAPLHRHMREDEYSFVLEGSLGALLGDEVVIGKPSDLVCMPRRQWHTLWNAGDTPTRVLAVISPAGLENVFREVGTYRERRVAQEQTLRELTLKYGMEVDVSSIPGLIERFGVRFPVDWPA